MNFEPQKFFIGLVDLFSILMPGALLAYLSKDWAGPLLLGEPDFQLDSAEAWIVFLFASYLLGHIAYLIDAHGKIAGGMKVWENPGILKMMAPADVLPRYAGSITDAIYWNLHTRELLSIEHIWRYVVSLCKEPRCRKL